MILRSAACALAISVLVTLSSAQAGSEHSGPGLSPPQPSAQSGDPLNQMRDDLNRLESLNQNMSSEIEFLHDQNLQILLRTNSRMWAVLIRDLRLQLEREEQQKSKGAPQSAK